MYNKWKLIINRCQLWENNDQVFPYKNTPTKTVSILSNRNSHYMIRLHFCKGVGITSCAKLIPLLIWALFWREGVVFSSGLISLLSFFLWDKLHCLLLSGQNGILWNFISSFNVSYVRILTSIIPFWLYNSRKCYYVQIEKRSYFYICT